MFVTSSVVVRSTVCVVHNTSCLCAAVSERYLAKQAEDGGCQFLSVTFPGKSRFSEKVGEDKICCGERK